MQASQSGQFVFVVKPDRTAEVRDIVVERQQGEEMVIAQGLAAGEEVVTDGQLRLTPGARVSTADARRGTRRRARPTGNGRGRTGTRQRRTPRQRNPGASHEFR